MVRITGCPVTDCSAIHCMCSKATEYFTMKLQLPACCLLVLLLSGDGATAQDKAASTPHVPRQGANLIVNPSVKGKANWTFARDADSANRVVCRH